MSIVQRTSRIKETLRILAIRSARFALRPDKAIIRRRFKEPLKALHLGCGNNIIPGWLNSDLSPRHFSVIQMDATRRFPLPDNSLNYIFSEHMIEHLPYLGGQQMLGECFRVLKPGGTVRVSTPDLKMLLSLWHPSDVQRRWMDWQAKTHIVGGGNGPVFALNNFVRNWGHQFIYDGKALQESMEKVGFNNLKQCLLNHSEHEPLRGLEHEERLPEAFVRLETMTFEGTK